MVVYISENYRRLNLYLHLLTYLQVSVSLMESGNPPEDHDELIELVASDETGFLSLFSRQQLQVSNTQFFTP